LNIALFLNSANLPPMPKVFFLVPLLLCISTALAQDCRQPLDAETLNQLSLGWTDVQLHPGESYQFSLAILSTYGPAKQIPACAVWKVAPAGKGATINSSGLLKIHPATPAGTKFVVTADIEQGRAQRQIPVLVYTDAAQPLVGFWKQQSKSDCEPGNTSPQDDVINEMEFRADGSFSVTWTPFEVYRDYWGSYKFDPAAGSLSLQIEHGNYVPGDFRGSGTYKLKDRGTLELTGIYLGNRQNYKLPENAKIGSKCHYIFTRTH
jgi:hypothetical protein